MSDAITADDVRAALSQVIDPEVGINIVDLGLIYEVWLSEDKRQIQVRMTMTTPACPMSAHISDEVREALRQRWPALRQVQVELVWDPPWSTDRLSDEARRQLGWNNT
jgi:metal-sulfur cluster biosynthetic enzyme